MEFVVVERRFEEPVSFEEIQNVEDEGAWCLRNYQVRFLKTFFSNDGTRMLCLYEAPDAEAVRLAQAQAKVPFERVWTCERFISDSPPKAKTTEYVVVERELTSPVTIDTVNEKFKQMDGCFSMHRVSHVESFLRADGLNLVCVFRAPDAEAVRVANDQGRATYTDVWGATFHPA